MLTIKRDSMQFPQAHATFSCVWCRWVFALPIMACSLRIDDEVVSIAVGLSLDVAVYEPHCICIVLYCIYGFLKRLSQYSLIRDAPSAESPARKEKS